VSDFQALLLEGIFYQDDDHGLMVTPDKGPPVRVIDALMRLNERNVQISAHHLPVMPPDPTRWGGGCCFWEQGRAGQFKAYGSDTEPFCPFGHHHEPTKLFNLVAQGILHYKGEFYPSEDRVVIHQFDGTEVDFKTAFQSYLPGHRGRIAAATVVDIEKMREALLKSGGLGMVEGMGERINDLKDMLSRMQDEIKDED
jgi:hypothetical protein